MIVKLCQSILTSEGQGVSENVFDATKTSVANIHSVTFKNNACNNCVPLTYVSYWNM